MIKNILFSCNQHFVLCSYLTFECTQTSQYSHHSLRLEFRTWPMREWEWTATCIKNARCEMRVKRKRIRMKCVVNWERSKVPRIIHWGLEFNYSIWSYYHIYYRIKSILSTYYILEDHQLHKVSCKKNMWYL